MARNDSNHGDTGKPSRTHKASQVHKRRAGDRPAATAKKTEPSDSGTSPAQVGSSNPSSEGELLDDRLPVDASADVAPAQPANSDEATEEQPDALREKASDEEPPSEGPESSSEKESEERSEEADAPSKPKKPLWKRVVGIVVGVVLAVLLVLVGYVTASRWLVFNDENDIQGKWYVYGTDVPLTFDNGSIAINSDTSYAYQIDPTAKTINYSFGNLAGQGRYWFNDARNTLVITDGNNYTMWSTLADDLSYSVRSLFGNTDLPTTDTSIVLTRTIVKAPPAATTSADDASASSAGSSASSQESSEASEAGDTSREKPSEMLKVSDIMIDEEEYD